LLVALERLGERGCGFLALAGGVQHLGGVAERVALPVQRIGALADRDGLAGELFGLGALAAAGVDDRRTATGPRSAFHGRCASARPALGARP
jgi:hypothetical protein